MNNIPFIDLKIQKERLGNAIEEAIHKVLAHGLYIMGPEVYDLEKKLSLFCGAKHTISCANGTDALALVLMAKGITEGDAVFVPSFTFAATAEVVAWVNATPIFIDVLKDTYNMDPASLKMGIDRAKELGLRPKAVMTVDVFGQPADYLPIEEICKNENLWLLSDAAQSFGAAYLGRKVGTLGLATATSFFPSKPLGCYGDGGAVFTDDEELAEIIRSLRVHGQGSDKYENVRVGMNGRMDTLQAAILLEKLKIFPEEILSRHQIATRYNEGLRDIVETPQILKNTTSVWAQYGFLLKNQSEREKIMMHLKNRQIPTAIYYPKPLHHQPAYKHYPTATGRNLPVSEDLANRILSIPMHAYISLDQQSYIMKSLKEAYQKECVFSE